MRIIAAIVAPRNTSSDIRRAGPGELIGRGAAAFIFCPAGGLDYSAPACFLAFISCQCSICCKAH